MYIPSTQKNFPAPLKKELQKIIFKIYHSIKTVCACYEKYFLKYAPGKLRNVKHYPKTS